MNRLVISPTLILFIFITFLPSSYTYAKNNWIKLKKAHVHLERPSEWKVHKNFLGFPLLLLGPIVKKSRISIGITPTDIKDFSYKVNEFRDSKKTYQKNAEKWISNKEGKIHEFFSYKKEKWKHAENIHHYGFRYSLGPTSFIEHSYYAHCQGQLFLIKVLYREKIFKKSEPEISSILESFNCQPKVESYDFGL